MSASSSPRGASPAASDLRPSPSPRYPRAPRRTSYPDLTLKFKDPEPPSPWDAWPEWTMRTLFDLGPESGKREGGEP